MDGMRYFLMFGAETTGLPDIAHEAATDIVKIPMHNFEHVRSLNLATSVRDWLVRSAQTTRWGRMPSGNEQY